MTPKICTKEQTENTHRKTKPQLGLKYASQTTSIQHIYTAHGKAVMSAEQLSYAFIIN